jgi:hypothetical protein
MARLFFVVFVAGTITKLLVTVSNDCPYSYQAAGTLWVRGFVSPIRSLEMQPILGLSLALLLFGSVWATVVGGGSLSQHKGAWVSHASR